MTNASNDFGIWASSCSCSKLGVKGKVVLRDQKTHCFRCALVHASVPNADRSVVQTATGSSTVQDPGSMQLHEGDSTASGLTQL